MKPVLEGCDIEKQAYTTSTKLRYRERSSFSNLHHVMDAGDKFTRDLCLNHVFSRVYDVNSKPVITKCTPLFTTLTPPFHYIYTPPQQV